MNQKSLMISLLQRVLASHVLVLGEDDKSAPAHVVRCIKRILGAICTESRRGSPHPGLGGEGDMSHYDDLFAPLVCVVTRSC